jgi:hypothetical protein
MPEFLSDDWFDAARAIAGSRETAGGSCRVDVVVTGAPGGDVQWHVIVANGSSADIGPGAGSDADVTLTLTFPDAVAVQRGELDPSVAFMQGRMKTTGDPGKLLDVLAATATPTFAEVRAQLSGVTEL